MGKMSERFGQNKPSLTEKFPIDVQLGYRTSFYRIFFSISVTETELRV
jgi:hypothetical protein